MSWPERFVVEQPITSVFVYGTLKRGQCRQSRWPRRPLDIRPGYVRGQLFDLGAYPALLCGAALRGLGRGGCDWVAGQLWRFSADDIEATLARLDVIEVTNQPGQANLYDRIVVPVHDSPSDVPPTLALAYQFCNHAALGSWNRVPACQGSGLASWPISLQSPSW